MSTAIQRRRGTTSQHATFTGLAGETTVDTDKNTVVVHNGSTAGGFPLLRENFSNASGVNAIANGGTGASTADTARSNLGAASSALEATRIDVASAATVNLTTSAPNTRHINITGTTAITAFTVASGSVYFVRFAGALTLTNNANIVTQTGSNITTEAGATCILRATAANTVEVLSYTAPPNTVKISLGTAVTSTSGTSIDFTGVPSWANRITIMFRGVSLSGSSYYLVQIGAGSFLTSGYESAGGLNDVSGYVDVQTSSNGFIIRNSAVAAAVVRGTMVLTRITGNTWVSSHALGDRASVTTSQGGGDVALSGTLDRVRITTVNGTDTFDAGTINISWE